MTPEYEALRLSVWKAIVFARRREGPVLLRIRVSPDTYFRIMAEASRNDFNHHPPDPKWMGVPLVFDDAVEDDPGYVLDWPSTPS